MITRESRSLSICAILRVRIASSMRCLITGCSAVTMKKIQKMSPTDMTGILVVAQLRPSQRIEPVDSLVLVVGAVAACRAHDQWAERQAGDEAADMRPPRHATAGRRHDQLDRSLKELDKEPETGKHNGRYFEEERNKKDRDEDDDARPGKRPHEAAENAGNRSRGAQRRNDRRWAGCDMRKRGKQAAQDVEQQKTPVAETIFDSGTEQPKRPHVEDQMQPAAVQEHHGEE